MKLILMRHGPAVDREIFQERSQKDDSQRPLTPKGKARALAMLQKLEKWDLEVDLIISSPFLRCQETAKLAREVFPKASYWEAIELTPASPPEAFLKWLKLKKNEAENILIVGHEPQLGSFASLLLGQKGGESFLEIKKASLLCLEVESCQDLSLGAATLQWLLPPKLVL